jgi:hypothetical protein
MDEVLAKKAVATLGDEAGFKAVEKLVLSPTRMKAWKSFVANTLDSGMIAPQRGRPNETVPVDQNKTMTVGILPLWLARKALDEKAPFAPILHVPDRLIVGKKARRHQEAGNALTRDNWVSLPVTIQGARWYKDTKSGNLVAYRASDNMAVTFDQTGKADSAYHDGAAAGKIERGEWMRIER